MRYVDDWSLIASRQLEGILFSFLLRWMFPRKSWQGWIILELNYGLLFREVHTISRRLIRLKRLSFIIMLLHRLSHPKYISRPSCTRKTCSPHQRERNAPPSRTCSCFFPKKQHRSLAKALPRVYSDILAACIKKICFIAHKYDWTSSFFDDICNCLYFRWTLSCCGEFAVILIVNFSSHHLQIHFSFQPSLTVSR